MAKQSGFKKFLGVIAAIGLSALGASQAHAGFTTINAPHPGEKTQAQILSHSYGGNFVADGVNFTNGSTTAYRIDDDYDQIMPFDILSSKTLARFAEQSQGMGYGDVNAPTELFQVVGKGYNATGGTGAIDLPGLVELIRTGDGQNFSSKQSSNVDKKDHLVTYLLIENKIVQRTSEVESDKKLAESLKFVLFWEDLSGKKADFDYNDLAVEIKAVSPVLVPLPAAAWSGLSTLAAGALLTGYRRMRRQVA